MGISDHVLRELARAGRCVLIDELDDRLPEHPRKEIIKSIGALISRELAQREYPGCYAATDDGRARYASGKPITSGPKGPHTGRRSRSKGTFAARLWNALRAARKGTTADLVSVARTDEDKKPEQAAGRYIARWYRAGFVTKLSQRAPGTAPTSNGFIKWFLVRDNGPTPPLWKEAKQQMIDGNTGEIFTADGLPVEGGAS